MLRTNFIKKMSSNLIEKIDALSTKQLGKRRLEDEDSMNFKKKKERKM